MYIFLRGETTFWKMEKLQRIHIYCRINNEFNINKFRKHYYCSQKSYFKLLDKLYEHYPGSQVMVRTDHVVVLHGHKLHLYLLMSHSSGKCSSFFHEWNRVCIYFLMKIYIKNGSSYVMWLAVHFSIVMCSGSENTVVREKFTIFCVWGMGAQQSNGEHSKNILYYLTHFVWQW